MSSIIQEIKDAEQRIRPYILKTPLLESRELGELIQGKVFLKLESEQHTGSFKARGSLNKILSLTDSEKQNGVIAASTGNHALGFARALEIANVKGTVFLPENASPSKIESLKKYPIELKFHGRDSLTTEMYAKGIAEGEGKVWISPYNDEKVIGGQGTIAIELTDQLSHFDDILITVGGGGLISGIGSYLKEERPEVRIIGCQPENAPEMSMSVKAGEIVDLPEPLDTISDGSAGGIEAGSLTFPICQKVMDESILVSEKEIADGIKYIAYTHRKMIEGAAGVTIASLMQNPEKFKGRTVVIIICGSNISLEKFVNCVSNE